MGVEIWQTTHGPEGASVMGEMTLAQEYPDSEVKIWAELTEPHLTALWSMRPEGYEPVVGNTHRLIWKPVRGWRGYFDAEVLQVLPRRRVVSQWDADGKRRPLTATFTLTPFYSGHRLEQHIAGFQGYEEGLLNPTTRLRPLV